MDKTTIKKFLKKIPRSPGVYVFLSKTKKNLYVGKAINLKNRVSSYFHGAQTNPKILKMLELAQSLEFKKTDSEIEALILESQLIKKLKPIYNTKLRDDKQYFYVGITRERFPKIFLTHQIQDARYKILDTKFIGPFTDGMALKTTLRLLRRIFPYCTCKQKHNNFCLNYHIGKCPGYCCLKKEAPKEKIDEYKRNIKSLENILTGKRTVFVEKLKKEMVAEGNRGNLEEAIKLQKQIKKLEKVFENAKILRHFDNSKYFDDSKYRDNVLEELKKIFNLPELPKRIEGYDISNIQGTNATGAMVVFSAEGGPASGGETLKPNKNEYRKFKILRILSSEASHEGGYGDTQMLKEILLRRFNHPEWPYPDLILIDGGKAQLNAAVNTMSKFKIPIIALTKDIKHKGDHIFMTNKKLPIKLDSLPDSVKNLILFIDSEAHRFAITYYRKLHRRTIG